MPESASVSVESQGAVLLISSRSHGSGSFLVLPVDHSSRAAPRSFQAVYMLGGCILPTKKMTGA